MSGTATLEVKETVQTVSAQLEMDGLLRLGLYANQDEVIADAIHNLLINNPSLRLELGLELFKSDEVSLGRAAEIAGMNRWQFMDEMKARGIKQVIEGDSAEVMDEGIAFFFSKKR